MGVKLRDMERNIIEVLQKIQAERVTSRNTAILNSKAESGASLEHHSYSDVDVNIERVTSKNTPILTSKAESGSYSDNEHSDIDDYVIPNEAISTDVEPREKLISEAADTSMPTLRTRAESMG